ncbi:hypothetical protein [Tumebacillus permanentifrigoris]|uniref:Spore germination protein GerPA/GerPF n=1 Tax=Tumebacillus permanentifrigoris TaxID=378543 RepID=A0A316D2E9_9BACL|nr:hypothetical protein [Tumebacillus permanentifrigoris]PWK05038.1 spore germination protein GerPA/GerPF [Tumebacillus permanentifrigoris]
MKVKLHVENLGDVKIGDIKINSISSSSIVIFGDAECFTPNNVSITRGMTTPISVAQTGPGGPVGAIR